jgi:hypothetical protein
LRAAPSARRLDRPLFIIGSVRSGTTVLARWLGEHPQIYWARGRRDIELACEWRRHASIDIGMPLAKGTHCPPLTAADATPERRARVNEVFAALLDFSDKTPGARFLGKMPHFCNKLDFVRALFPDAGLIVTARDLRSTVLSTQVLWMRTHHREGTRHYLPPDEDSCWSCSPPLDAAGLDPARLFPGGDVAVIAEYWLRSYEAIERSAPLFATCVLIRHRDFAADPWQAIDRICTANGLEHARWEPAVPIDPDRNQRWPKLLTRRERDRVEEFIDRHRERIARLEWADTLL